MPYPVLAPNFVIFFWIICLPCHDNIEEYQNVIYDIYILTR
jgi:hypothetical protein